MTVRSIGGRVPAPVLFVVGGLSMYVGAALAVGLFDRLSPDGGGGAAAGRRGAAAARLATAGPGRPGGPAAGPGSGVRGGHRGHERGLLRGHRPAAVGYRGGHRVLRAGGGGGGVLAPAAGCRSGRAGRASGCCSSRTCAGQAARPGCCGRSPRPPCGRPTSCSASGWPAPATGWTRWPSGSRVATVVLSPLLLVGRPGALAALADPLVLLAAVRGRRAVQRGALRAGPDRAAPGRAGPVRGAAGAAAGDRDASVGLLALAQVPGPLEAVGIAAVIAAVALRSRDGDTPAPVG